MRILIVEDEKAFATEISEFLTKEFLNCDTVHTKSKATEAIAVNPYDIVLLDIGLPDGSGFDLIADIKSYNPEAYIIFITARNELNDKIHGFNLGADDYLPKPFSLVELHLRIQAIIRRKFGVKEHVVPFGDFRLDTRDKQLYFNQSLVSLTAREYKLLSYMVLNKNRILDRMQLTEHIWGDFFEDDFDSNYIDVHVKNIRKKLTIHDERQWIKTIRGVGYVFENEG